MKRKLLATMLLATSSFVMFSIPAGASAPNPYAEMKLVIADANAELSVRVTTTATMSGMRIVQITDAGRTAGRQIVTLSGSGKSNTVIAELIAGKLYVKGDTSILTNYLGLSQATANELAGQWFGIPKSSGYYAEIASGLTISSGMAEVTMTNAVTTAPQVTIAGAKVSVLKGTSVKSALEASFKETLYFSNAKKPLPLKVTQSVQGSLGTIVFSRWNEKFNLVAPKVKLQLN
jgi:hypothetical protein